MNLKLRLILVNGLNSNFAGVGVAGATNLIFYLFFSHICIELPVTLAIHT